MLLFTIANGKLFKDADSFSVQPAYLPEYRYKRTEQWICSVSPFVTDAKFAERSEVYLSSLETAKNYSMVFEQNAAPLRAMFEMRKLFTGNFFFLTLLFPLLSARDNFFFFFHY